MIFVKSPVFTADVRELLDDVTYGKLQQHLADHPDAGDLIQGLGVFGKSEGRNG